MGQIPIAVRFADSSNKIREEFLAFAALPEGVWRPNINKDPDNKKYLDPDMRGCRAQSYDGAGATSGKCIAAANLKQTNTWMLHLFN